ncbi:MAG: amidase family protein [Thermomicrobiales bacterium]
MSTDINPYSGAAEFLSALESGRVSSRELVELHIERIERHNPAINVIVTRNYDDARQAAREADAARSQGRDLPLTGLPITIKDQIDVQGLRTTGGNPDRADHQAETDAPNVARLKAAGAIILAKTNVPNTGDWQASNPLFGRTNNPWNLELTSGGSTGGAAAVATAMSPLELGSDIGGSIRIPAAFCGVYGHKPSETAMPKGNLPNPAVPLTVQGPLARNTADLELALNIMAGPVEGEDIAWRLAIPQARGTELSDFRVAMLPRLDWLPCDDDTMAAQQRLAGQLSGAGATVKEAIPAGLGDFHDYYHTYLSLLNALVARGLPEHVRERAVARLKEYGDEVSLAKARGMEATIGDYIGWIEQRERYRRLYRDFFRDWDVLISPVTICPAYPHTDERWLDRKLDVNGEPVHYDLLSAYPSLATLTGHPATNFPVGFGEGNSRLGLQAIGPYLEDRTSIRFASLVAREFGGFVAPWDYVD